MFFFFKFFTFLLLIAMLRFVFGNQYSFIYSLESHDRRHDYFVSNHATIILINKNCIVQNVVFNFKYVTKKTQTINPNKQIQQTKHGHNSLHILFNPFVC